MTKHQAEILFDSWIDKAERQGKDKEEYTKECLLMLSQEFINWFGHDFKEVKNAVN